MTDFVANGVTEDRGVPGNGHVPNTHASDSSDNRRGPAVDGSTRALHVVVAVLTYEREHLLRENLPEIYRHAQDVTRSWAGEHGLSAHVRVLVVDNDPARSAQSVPPAVDGAISYVVERTPGIAAARNCALREARDADLLAFIDDDERPRAYWLSSLLDVWATYRAAAVPGRVVPEYSTTPDPWILAGGFFDRPVRTTGTVMASAAAGNLLLDLHQLREVNLAFEEPFGMTGGEDSLLGRRLVMAGRTIIWCHDSVVEDLVPAERLTRQWVLQRAHTLGNLTSLIDVHLSTSKMLRIVTRVERLAASAVLVATGLGMSTVGTVSGSLRRQARGKRILFRGVGMACGAVGRVHEQYAREADRARTH